MDAWFPLVFTAAKRCVYDNSHDQSVNDFHQKYRGEKGTRWLWTHPLFVGLQTNLQVSRRSIESYFYSKWNDDDMGSKPRGGIDGAERTLRRLADGSNDRQARHA